MAGTRSDLAPVGKVTFPGHIASHCKEQTFYSDADGLIRRHDYIAEVLGSSGPAAHYSSSSIENSMGSKFRPNAGST